MPSLLDVAWIIPFAPILGAFFVWILLISFNRTINRLTKPVSYLLIICVGISTLLSFALFQKHLKGNILDLDLILLSLKLHLDLYVNNLAAIVSTIFGFFVILIMATSYYLMERKKGYVSYFIFLALACGSLFFFILSGDPFQRYF